jgi:hypothetical protein
LSQLVTPSADARSNATGRRQLRVRVMEKCWRRWVPPPRRCPPTAENLPWFLP